MIKKPRLGRRGELALLVAITLLAFTRGIWELGAKSLWWDESLSLHRARQDTASILAGTITLTDNTSTVATVDDHPPLYFLLLAGAVRLLGTSEFALRILSLACVVLLVPLLYCTGRRLIDRPAGLAAAFLGAVSPMYLWYGQEARPYALLTLLGLLSFYCFARTFLEAHKPALSAANGPHGQRGEQWLWGASYFLASVGMTLTHYLSILLVFFELAVLGIQLLRGRRSRWPLFGAVLAVLLIALVLVGYAVSRLPEGLGTSRAGVEFVPLWVLLRDLLNSFSLGLSVSVFDWYVLLIDLLFLLFVAFGVLRLVFGVRQPCLPSSGAKGCRLPSGWLLVGYLAVPVALIYLFSYVRPAYMTSRHLMIISPAFYLLLAAGLTWRGGRLLVATIAGWLVVSGGVLYSTRNYFSPKYGKSYHREWGAYLRAHVRPGDVVVIVPPHIAELYDYYAASATPWIGLPLLGQPEEQTVAKLEELLAQYDRVWLAISQTPWDDRDQLPETWLNEHAFRVDLQPFRSRTSAVRVAAYVRSAPLLRAVPDEASPIDVRYRPSLRLAGYQLVSPARPGDRLHVQLFWAVDDPIQQEASVLLRLVDGEGHVWGQGEQCPFGGLFPMWQWTPGYVVRDEHELLIVPGTPPGNYQLEVVLIDRPSEQGCAGPAGQAVPPIAAPEQMNRGDRVLLGAVQVERAAAPAALDGLDIERTSHAQFDGLELIGSAVEATVLRPGDRVDLRLYWRALNSSMPDWQFRLMLVDSAGQVLSERVIRPAGDGYPTTQWQAQDRLEGQFWWRVPDDAPAGDYSLELVPIAPLRRTNGWAALLRRLWTAAAMLPPARIRLDTFHVVQTGTAGLSTPSAPVVPPQGLVVEHPMLATLGDQVRFLGYDLDPEPVQAGQPLTLTLYWQALAPMDRDYTVFTHLLGPGNQVLAQKDNQPRAGTYPTTRWQPGEVVTDSYRLAPGPEIVPGSYAIEIGLYRLETDTRLPVTGADGRPTPDNRILLEPVTVVAPPTAVPTLTPAAPDLPFRVFVPLLECGSHAAAPRRF